MKRIATVRTIVARSLIAIVSAASLVVAQPAYALSGLVHDSETTETSTSLTKGLTVSCPPGKKGLSGGADIDQVSEGGRIIGLEPDTDNGAWFRADAAVEPGLSGKVPWSLTVHIICADPPAGGLHYTKVTTRPNREATQWVRPYCGAGEKLVGFGGRVATDTKPRNVALTAVLPDIDLKNLLVHGIEMEAGEDRDWSVTASLSAPRQATAWCPSWTHGACRIPKLKKWFQSAAPAVSSCTPSAA